jgi:hypothetical protein
MNDGARGDRFELAAVKLEIGKVFILDDQYFRFVPGIHCDETFEALECSNAV